MAHHLLWSQDNYAGTNLTLESPLAGKGLPATGGRVDILVRLPRPFVDAAKCIGCGMCEHECPVSGRARHPCIQ